MLAAAAQAQQTDAPLDLARDPSALARPAHGVLAEQYVWTAGDAAALRPDHAKFTYRNPERKAGPHAFRGGFDLARVPAHATLYIAGPRAVKAYINGKLVLDAASDPQSPLATHVYHVSVDSALRAGRNLLAIEAVRGRGIVAASDSPVVQQMAYGESLVAKIVPAEWGREETPIAISGGDWRSLDATPQGWQTSEFDDSAWPRVQSLGAIESSPDFFQWNTDAGMYDWPGYQGLSPALGTYNVLPVAVTHTAGDFSNLDALLHPNQQKEFSIEMSPNTSGSALMLDFGREMAGRLVIESDCDCVEQVKVSYGESEGEALSGEQYLGTNTLNLLPHGTARGPKSAFRYAYLQFVLDAGTAAFRSLRAEGIAYPVRYRGSFESSDPALNRIWETAAYTAHLCMQDDLWDAPKRDRGRWAGDLDVSGPVIGDVFGDSRLLDTTLARLVPPAGQHVNGIPSFSALWITALADLYRRNGDLAALAQKHDALLALLAWMDADLDDADGFTNKNHRWLFVDWAPDLFAYTDQAREGTELQYLRGFREGAWLLGELGDLDAARRYSVRANALAATARRQFAAAGSFWPSWQLNALAVLSGVADQDVIWDRVLSHVGTGDGEQTISPYFNFYLMEAMARAGHRREALDWLRTYWGGMIAEGATSFWESYDPRWPKENPHHSLQADGRTGYFVSLAHGWSAGPAAWLAEEILGIKATEPGFRKVRIRPDLAGLEWARGAVPAPEGEIRVEARGKQIVVAIPSGVQADLLLPAGDWTRNGAAVQAENAEDGQRLHIVLAQAGTYEFTRR